MFNGGSPSENAHTAIYLSAKEFGGRLAGLVLAEVDLETSGIMPSTSPIKLSDEVTNDERFTGGELAKKTTQQLTSILDSFDIH